MKRGIAFLFILIANACVAQNLVPNPSFEEYTECPFSNGQLPFATPWFTPYYWVQSSEYYNLCDSTTGGTCPIYQIQLPKTGNGMAACVFFGSPSPSLEYREYLEVKLSESLVSNHSYCISYYANLSGYSAYAIDALCASLTSDSLLNQDPNANFLYCTNLACNQINNIIKDTLNWTKVSMNYIAQGGEQFITIGNFKLSSQTNYIYTNYPIGLNTYYYIDDVAVYECNTPEYPANTGGDQCIDAGDTLTLGMVQRAEYLYWWYDMQGNLLDTTAILTVSPTQTTSYVLVQKDFKFDETRDTVTVKVGNCPIDYSGVDFEIYPNPCNGELKVRFNSIVPSGSAIQIYDMIGRKVAEIPLTGTENIATVNLENLATAVYHATVVVPDGFRKSVKLVVIR